MILWIPRPLGNELKNIRHLLLELRQYGFTGIKQHDDIKLDCGRAREAAEISNDRVIVDHRKVALLETFHLVVALVRREKHEAYFGGCAPIGEVGGFLGTGWTRQAERQALGAKSSHYQAEKEPTVHEHGPQKQRMIII